MKTRFPLFMVIQLCVVGCSNTINKPNTLKVMTHDSFAVSEGVVAAFQDENDVFVQFIEAGDTGTALNKAILSKNVPLADVFYGVDNTFISRALEEGIFEPYDSPMMEEVPDQFKVSRLAAPVDFGDVCLNYDQAYFDRLNLQPPQNIDSLRDPLYKGLLVVENPATSSPGLAFLFATIARYGEQEYLEFWRALVENDVLVVNDWETAYYSEFSRWGGTRPIVVSYASSPPFEVVFAEEPMETPQTAAITSDLSCFRQIEYVGILKGTEKRKLAEKFIDFMLSTTFQEDIPLQMFVFPVNKNAQLNETFIQYLEIPKNPATLDPQKIAENRELWILEWTEIVLR